VTNPREAWQSPDYPVTGPGSQPHEWTMTTLHWPGGTINAGDPVGTLRVWQQSWCNSKGYSLGYNFCVFPDGSQWEVRGFDIACAANGNQTVNVPAIAINLCVPDVNTAPSVAMVESVVDLIEQTRARQPAAVIINGHRDVRPEPTSCPGDVIYSWITAGMFEPGATPATTVREKPMIVFQYEGQPDAWWITDGLTYRRLWSFPAIDVIKLWQTLLGYPASLQAVQQLTEDQIAAAGNPAPGETPIAL
jgi:hypothetical protein